MYSLGVGGECYLELAIKKTDAAKIILKKLQNDKAGEYKNKISKNKCG